MKISKKILAIVLAVIMVISVLPFSVFAATSADGNWDYNSGSGTVNSYVGPGTSGTLTMPHIMNGNAMKTIGEQAFMDLNTYEPRPHVNELIVEEGYETLDYASFAGADINRVVLPSTITDFGDYTFYYAGVQEVELKSGTTLSDGMFGGCTLKKLIVPDTITSVGDIFVDADISDLTIVVKEGSTTEQLLKDVAPDATYEHPSSHTHNWEISAMSLNVDDRQTINVELTCSEDGATSIAYITDYNPIDGTVQEATCLADGSMKINATFTKDEQSFTVDQNSIAVTLPKYEKHDYSVQKWVWKDNTPTDLYVYCAHCTKEMYDNPENSYAELHITGSTAPNNYLKTISDNDWTVGRINTSHMFFDLGLPFYANYGTVYSNNDYEYYSDAAPVWNWEADLSAATATFRDNHVENATITSQVTKEPTAVQTGTLTVTATVNYNGNVYTSVRTKVLPVVVTTYTITWKNEDGTVIDTTEVDADTVPTHADPIKTDDVYYTYTFAGWTPEIVAATASAEYTAQFTSSAKAFKVSVKKPDNTTFDINNVTGETTVAQLKAMIADETGVPATEQKLVFAGSVLENENTFADYSIRKEDTIRLYINANNGSSLTLTDGVKFNAYIDADAYGVDANAAVVKLTYNHNADIGKTKAFSTDTIALTDATKYVKAGDPYDGTYKFAFSVAPAQYAEDITIELYATADAETPLFTTTTNVKSMCEKVIALAETESTYAAYANLCKALADYCQAAQVFFSYDAPATPAYYNEAVTTLAAADMEVPTAFVGIEAAGFSFTIVSALEVNVFYNGDLEIQNVSINSTKGADTVNAETTTKGGKNCINITGIASGNLDNMITVNTSAGVVELSATNIAKAIAGSANTNYANLARALYLYSVQASAFFGA